MKLPLAVLLVLSVAGCAVVAVDGSGKAGGGTTLVCHKGKRTLEVPANAADAHINHGDRYGRC